MVRAQSADVQGGAIVVYYTKSRKVRRERFYAHQLRHTFACRWIEAGGSLAALQIEARGVAKGVANRLEARTGNV